ncbi:MAG TPA: elongation factor G, partial [bacterium]|nr:elongation factor G [bacterium]
LPIGLENDFKGVIDLVEMKAYGFEGDDGSNVIEFEIPDEMIEDAKKYRSLLVEKIAESDDVLIEKYLNGEDLTIEEIKTGLRKLTVKAEVYPVFCGASLSNKGVQKLLDGVVEYLPSPKDVPDIVGVDVESGEQVSLKPDENGPFAALAFKIQTDPYVGRLTYFRVYSGKVNAGSYVYNSTSGKKERLGRILLMHANHREEIKEALAGEIVAGVGLEASTGDTLCSEDNKVLLEKISFSEPVIGIVIEPKTKADRDKMSQVVKKFLEEDPTLQIKTNIETGQTLLYGMGELHLDIVVDRMRREFNLEINTGKPQVAYRETIRNAVEKEGKYIRQSGGRGQYGHVVIKLEPLGRGEGIKFVDKIVGGVIPKEYIPAVEKGVKEAAESGVIAGYPLVDFQVTLFDGSFHEVDSSEMAFKMATIEAMREAQKAADTFLLEPIMKVEVITPEEFMGDVIGNLSSKRGKIESTEQKGNARIISAKVPLAEMFGYATELRGLTQGRASFIMEPSHYEEVPTSIAEGLAKDNIRH